MRDGKNEIELCFLEVVQSSTLVVDRDSVSSRARTMSAGPIKICVDHFPSSYSLLHYLVHRIHHKAIVADIISLLLPKTSEEGSVLSVC